MSVKRTKINKPKKTASNYFYHLKNIVSIDTFVSAGHFLCFCCRIFYPAVVVKQESLLLLKKLIDFLCRKRANMTSQ